MILSCFSAGEALSRRAIVELIGLICLMFGKEESDRLARMREPVLIRHKLIMEEIRGGYEFERVTS